MVCGQERNDTFCFQARVEVKAMLEVPQQGRREPPRESKIHVFVFFRAIQGRNLDLSYSNMWWYPVSSQASACACEMSHGVFLSILGCVTDFLPAPTPLSGLKPIMSERSFE